MLQNIVFDLVLFKCVLVYVWLTVLKLFITLVKDTTLFIYLFIFLNPVKCQTRPMANFMVNSHSQKNSRVKKK